MDYAGEWNKRLFHLTCHSLRYRQQIIYSDRVVTIVYLGTSGTGKIRRHVCICHWFHLFLMLRQLWKFCATDSQLKQTWKKLETAAMNSWLLACYWCRDEDCDANCQIKTKFSRKTNARKTAIVKPLKLRRQRSRKANLSECLDVRLLQRNAG